jgi:hypothetical protein
MNKKEFNAGLNLLMVNYKQQFEPLQVKELKMLFKERFTGEEWLNILREIKRTRKDFLPTEYIFHEVIRKLGLYQKSQYEIDREKEITGEGREEKYKRQVTAKEMIADLEKKGFNFLAKKIKERGGF